MGNGDLNPADHSDDTFDDTGRYCNRNDNDAVYFLRRKVFNKSQLVRCGSSVSCAPSGLIMSSQLPRKTILFVTGAISLYCVLFSVFI